MVSTNRFFSAIIVTMLLAIPAVALSKKGKTAKANDLTDQQLDAVTGATPQASGTQTFTWDFTDQQGKTVQKGDYKVFVEATLFNASTITYFGFFSTQDKAGSVALISQLTEPDEKHKDMVTEVKAVLK